MNPHENLGGMWLPVGSGQFCPHAGLLSHLKASGILGPQPGARKALTAQELSMCSQGLECAVFISHPYRDTRIKVGISPGVNSSFLKNWIFQELRVTSSLGLFGCCF